ncbi:MAG: GTP cyclohydrolase FolE2 [Desulfuromonadia bacterium]
MKDIQQLPDSRKIAIDKVGVKDISYPVIVMDKKNRFQHTVARINLYVDLPHHFKGTHMSRFVEVLNQYREAMALDKLEPMLGDMKRKLGARTAHLQMEFPYFIEKRAPVSGARGLMEYRCSFDASLSESFDFILGVQVPVTSLCPCSKEISEAGAHNQRSLITVRVRYADFIWIEDLIRVIERCGSAPLFSLLKRPDEKYVTETAYANPKFVEDIVRDVTESLQKLPEITWFSVEVENFESIHNHSAYAFVERTLNHIESLK